MFAAQYPGTAVDAQFWTNLNTAVTGSTFLLASELAAFQAVASAYSLNRAQAATYFVAVILSTDPTSLGLSTTANPANPNGLSDQQTYINQFNAATNRAIVSGNYANQSATASNLNYPVVGPAANPGYVGGVNAESGVSNLSSSVVTAENSIAIAAAANNPALIPNVPAPGTIFQLTTGVDAPGTGAFAFGSPAGNSTIFGAFNGGTTTYTPGDNIQATGTGNVLSLTDNGAGGNGNVNSVSATVSGVQTLNATSGEALTINTATGVGGFTGLTQLNVTSASQAVAGVTNVTTITAGANTNVTVTDTATQGAAGAGTGGVTVNGGKNIVITENGATTNAAPIVVGGTAATNPAGTVSVSVTGNGNTSVAIDGGTGTTVTTSQSGAVTIGANTASTGAVTVTDTNGTITNQSSATPMGAITVTGGTSIAVTGNARTTGAGQLGILNPVVLTGNASTATITVNQSGVYGSLAAVGAPAATTNSAAAVAAGTAAGTTITVTSTAGVRAGDLLQVGGVTVGVVGTVNVGGVANTINLQGATAVAVAGNAAITFAHAYAPGLWNLSGGNNTATGGININSGSAAGSTVNVTTTGNFNGTGIVIGGTTVAKGTTTVVNTNSLISSADAITIAANAASNTTGAISVTTTATSGAIQVGTNALSQGVSGNVTVVNQTAITGGATYYGNGTINISTVGATTVAVTGGAAGGGSTVIDNATTKTLATLNLTGFSGALTATSSALTTATITNSAQNDFFNVARTATALTVTNSTADHTLGLTLTNTGTGTAIVDNTAKVLNITANGANNFIAITATDTPVTGNKTFNFVNNGTGTLTVTAATNTNGTSVITTSGSGAVNLGNLTTFAGYGGAATTWTVLPTSITQSGTGGITAEIAGSVNAVTNGVVRANAGVTSFAGGTSSGNVITVDGGAAGLSSAITGGSGSNDTVFLTSAQANYLAAPGAGISGFETLGLAGGAVTGSYTASPYTGLAVKGLTQTAVAALGSGAAGGNSVTFTNVNASAPLAIQAQAATSSTTQTINYAAGSTYRLTINGVNFDGAAGANQAAAVGNVVAAYAAAPLPGITVAANGGNTAVVVTGAATIATAITAGAGTWTDTNTLSGAVILNYAAGPAAATGNALPITLNTADNTTGVVAVVNEANNQSISINSVLAKNSAANAANTINITDSTLLAAANNATSLTITGAGNLTATYSAIGTAANALATINAGSSSGAVNTVNVQTKTTGVTITGGSGTLTAAGGGVATGSTVANYRTGNDVISTGSGGGVITTGYQGSGGAAGTTTINLAASLGKSDVIKNATDATFGARATINNFTVSSASTADKFTFNDTKVVISTNATPAAAGGAGATDTYTVSNGIITFTGGDSLATKTASAIAAVDAANANNGNAATNNIAAFTYGSDTYVVTSGNTGAQSTTTSSVYKLAGVSGITQIGGSTAAAGSVWSTNVTGATIAVGAGTATTDATGYSIATVTANAATTQTINNLAPSAIITDASTNDHSLVITQTGAAGSNSLTINETGNANHALTSLNYTGGNALTINNTSAGATALTLTSIVDSGNTLATLNLGGTKAIVLSAITDSALTTINVTNTGDVDIGLAGTALSNNNLTVAYGTSATPLAVASGSTLYLSGVADTINLSNATFAALAANYTFSATGANATILGGTSVAANGVTLIASGADSTVTMKQGTIAAVGVAGVAGDAGTNLITIGDRGVVTLGTDATGVASDVGSRVTLSTATYDTGDIVTINNARAVGAGVGANDTKLAIFATGVNVNGTVVDVASATTWLQAANLALTVATNNGVAGNNYYAGFQWTDGNTYVIGHQGAAATSLSAADSVIKLTGLLNIDLTVDTTNNIISL